MLYLPTTYITLHNKNYEIYLSIILSSVAGRKICVLDSIVIIPYME